ncbi:MAG: single-stranded DNA-binding protein [Paraclostridium sp.]
MNNIVVIGRLTHDPELKYTPTSGTPIGQFNVAVDSGRKDKEGKPMTDFLPVRCFGKTAENCANYLAKGALVAVNGSMKIDSYEKDGEKKRFAYINAGRVQFLQSKKDGQSSSNTNNSNDTGGPEFNPSFGLDPQGFQAIDDDDIPF